MSMVVYIYDIPSVVAVEKALYGPIPTAVDAAMRQKYSVFGFKSYKLNCKIGFKFNSSSRLHESV